MTATGIMLNAGDTVSISATGAIKIASGDVARSPAGEPTCVAGPAFTVPGLPCFSLVGRIGTGPAFPVGTGPTTISATEAGELLLGVNDDVNTFGDNSGSWSVTATVTTAGTETSPGAPVANSDAYTTNENTRFDGARSGRARQRCRRRG
jgi:hypothetical protein